jgi:histidinol-phosphate aminotransferase
VDFVDPAHEYSAIPLLEELPNVLILRSFSKGYGLAGLRLGYLMGAQNLIDPIVSKTRDSYNIDHVSQCLGLAAFADRAYAQHTWTQVREQRERLAEGLMQLGFDTAPSQANFLLARIPFAAPRDAPGLYAALKARGILVRYFDAPRLHDKLRITVGTAAQNSQLLDTLRALL